MKTHVIVVLDKSSSMQSCFNATLNDYNELVSMCQDRSKEKDHQITCSLVTFNHDVTEHFWQSPVEDLKPATEQDYVCSGCTALNDAVGWAYSKALEGMVPNLEDKDAILIHILTDGMENSSIKFHGKDGLAKTKEMAKELEKTKQVTITFVGTDRRAVEQSAVNFGVSVGSCAVMDTSNENMAQNGYDHRASGTRCYFAARSQGRNVVNNFMGQEGIADFTNSADAEEKEEDKNVYTNNNPWNKKKVRRA